jgi:polyhydroxyalkanoate synthesis regulator phasin
MADRKSGTRTRKSGGPRRASASKRSSSSQGKSSGATKRKSPSTAKRKSPSTAKRKSPSTAKRKSAAKPRAAQTPDISGKTVAEVREALTQGIIGPLHLVMLTRDRIEETMNEAVERGRMTADDARDLVQGLIERGQRQTNDVLSDLEQLLGRGRTEVELQRKRGSGAASKARSRAVQTADPLLAQADRARRAAGVGPTFPIIGYDDLTAAQVQSRLGDLSPAELRKVRDYERRHANRKSVLAAVESKLG